MQKNGTVYESSRFHRREAISVVCGSHRFVAHFRLSHGGLEDQEDGIDDDSHHYRGGAGGQSARENPLQERDGQ